MAWAALIPGQRLIGVRPAHIAAYQSARPVIQQPRSGTTGCKHVHQTDLTSAPRHVNFRKGWRGQRQTWFLLRYDGNDDDVDLEAHKPAEFNDWKWVDAEQLPDLIIPFKKRVYRAVLEEFRALI